MNMSFTEAHGTRYDDLYPPEYGPVKIEVNMLDGCGDLIPVLAHEDDAGYDLRSRNSEPVHLFPDTQLMCPTGVRLGLPSGWEAQVRPRSGLAAKYGITILNSPGTIDAGYRGEICVILFNAGRKPWLIERGMRIAQLVFKRIPYIELVSVDELSGTCRADGGFGSTGSH